MATRIFLHWNWPVIYHFIVGPTISFIISQNLLPLQSLGRMIWAAAKIPIHIGRSKHSFNSSIKKFISVSIYPEWSIYPDDLLNSELVYSKCIDCNDELHTGCQGSVTVSKNSLSQDDLTTRSYWNRVLKRVKVLPIETNPSSYWKI